MKHIFGSRRADLAASAIGIAIVLLVGIISALVFFQTSSQVPHTDNATNETIESYTNYAKLSFGFIGLAAFIGAAFLIIGIMRGRD